MWCQVLLMWEACQFAGTCCMVNSEATSSHLYRRDGRFLTQRYPGTKSIIQMLSPQNCRLQNSW